MCRALGSGILNVTYTLPMNFSCLPKLPTFFALRDRASLLLNFEERAVVMAAGGRAVSFYAGLAATKETLRDWDREHVESRCLPGVLLVIDVNLAIIGMRVVMRGTIVAVVVK
jgi:hypothetical protein